MLNDITVRLHIAIAAVCPIDGVSIGLLGDKSTWRIGFSLGATDTQKTAAQNVIVGFDPVAQQAQIDAATTLAAAHNNYVQASIGVSVSGVVSFSDFLGRWQDTEYALLLQKRAAAVTAGNVTLIRQWDIALSQGFVDMALPATLNFKDAMVSNGILTQARANVIFFS